MELSRLGKYEIVAKIGQGGMGEVYRAHDPVLGRDVAIKIMSAGADADQDLRRRFLREARSAARLNHPNIVTVHDFGEDQGKLFIAMELLEGTDLREIIVNRTPLALPAKFSLLSQVCEGLAFAHDQDIVHRDIKPGNIQVQRNGHVKVMDFGLARGSTPDMTLAGSILGTPNYMSPEQVRGEAATRRSDVFALGVVFYELFTGRKAFDANSLAGVVYQVMSVEPAPVEAHDRTLPPGLSSLVAKAMAKDPADRHADAGELLMSLRALETVVRVSLDEAISKAPSGRGGPATPWPGPPRHTPLPTPPQPPTVLTAVPASGPSEPLDRTLAGDQVADTGEPAKPARSIETVALSSPVETISKAPVGRGGPPAEWPVPPRIPPAPTASPRSAALAASPAPVPSEAPAPPAPTVIMARAQVSEPAPRRAAETPPAPAKVRTAWIATGGVAAIVAIVAGPSVWQMLKPDQPVTIIGPDTRVSPVPATPPPATPAPTPTLTPIVPPPPVVPEEPVAVTAALREIKAALSARDEARAARGLQTLAALSPGHRELGDLSRRATELKKRMADDARRATERVTLERTPTPLPVAVLTALPTPIATAAPTASPIPPLATPMPTPAPTLAPALPPVQGEAAARQAIRGVLDEFRAAFERRDVEALRAVQPGVDYEQMKKSFASVSSYLVRIDVKDVSIQGDVARAKCSVTYNPVPKPAGKQRPVAQVFHLRRKGDLWIIERIEAE